MQIHDDSNLALILLVQSSPWHSLCYHVVSVSLSVTQWYCINMAEPRKMWFSQQG